MLVADAATGRKEGRKEMNQAEGEEEERSGGRLVEEV